MAARFRNLVMSVVVIGGMAVAGIFISKIHSILGQWVPLMTTITLIISVGIVLYMFFLSLRDESTWFLHLMNFIVLGAGGFFTGKMWGWDIIWGVVLGIVVGILPVLLDFFVIRVAGEVLRSKMSKKKGSKSGSGAGDDFSLGINMKNPDTGQMGHIDFADLFRVGREAVDATSMHNYIDGMDKFTSMLAEFRLWVAGGLITLEEFLNLRRNFGLNKLFEGKEKEENDKSTNELDDLDGLDDYIPR